MGTKIAETTLTDLAGMRFVAHTGSGFEVPMDAIADNGGQDSAPRPLELIGVGLSGCTGMDVISVLRKMRQEVTRLAVEVEGLARAEGHPRRWTELRVVFRVDGVVDADKLARAIDLSRTRYCSVAAMLRPQTEIRYRYVLNGGAPVDLPEPGNEGETRMRDEQ